MSLHISHLKEDFDAKEVERKKLQASLEKYETYEEFKASLVEKQNCVGKLVRKSSEKISPEMYTKECRNSHICNEVCNASSSCGISYGEENFPTLGHSAETNDEKNFSSFQYSVENNKKMFPCLGRSVASSIKMDIEHETSGHEIDIKNKEISLPNSLSMNFAYSNAECNINRNFESSIISSSTSEEYDNSTKYFDDNSQNHNKHTGSNKNNFSDDKQNFKHELNKNVHIFDNPMDDSDSMNPDEKSIGCSKSYTNISSAYKKHFDNSQKCVSKSYGLFCSIPPFSQNINSNLNGNIKESVPSPMSSPISEEHIDDHVSLEKLLMYNLEEMECDFFDYAYQLKNEILKEIGEFGNAVGELLVLCDLMEEDLPLRCQKKITTRMCELGEKYYRKAKYISKSNTKNFRLAQQENRKDCSASKPGRGYQRRNDNLRRTESIGREEFQ